MQDSKFKDAKFQVGDCVDVLIEDRHFEDPLIGWYQGRVIDLGHTTNPFVEKKKIFYEVVKLDDDKIVKWISDTELRLSVNPHCD